MNVEDRHYMKTNEEICKEFQKTNDGNIYFLYLINLNSSSVNWTCKFNLFWLNLYEIVLTCLNISLDRGPVECSVKPIVSSNVKSSGRNVG